MKGERSIEAKVGLLILVALGLLAAFVFVMGQVSFQPKFAIFVDFDNPGGLATGSAVRIAGVKVGKIDEIQYRGGERNPTTQKREPLVRVKVMIEKRYQQAVRDNSIFYVTTQGVLGEQFLQIDPGSGDRPVLAEGGVARGLDPPRLDMLLAEGFELLHTGVTVLRENRQQISETFEGLHDTLRGTGEFFKKNQDRLDRIAVSIEKLTQDSDDLVKAVRGRYVDNPEIARILGRIDQTTEVLSREAEPLLKDARETMGSIKNVAGAEQQAKIKTAISDLAEIASRAKAASADAQAIVAHIRKGNGSIGALVMDEQLYDDVQELARDLKHNPWKFFWRE
ncbi:MAG TPA: MlaD family protein [Polyangiaceae bacterium]|nr:MlaD family protein [Polyangiaceae bacterium]